MRILIASHWFLKLVVPQQAAALARQGHAVAVLIGDHCYEFGGDSHERLRHLSRFGLETFELGREPKADRSGVVPFLRAASRVRAWRPDVVSVHQNHDPFMWAAVRNYPLAYTIHDPEPHPGARPLDRVETATERRWVGSARAIVIHSENVLQQMAPELQADPRLAVVPHGVDVADRPLSPPGEPTILMFGRLEKYKGIEVLMKAMPLVWGERPDVKLIVAGEGPAASEVIEDPRINLIDRYVLEEELPDLLSRASVCVLPYTQASQSGVGLLAIAHGIPTVVTDVGGLVDLAESESRIARSSDPVSLAQALLGSLDADELERRSTIRFARETFSWDSVAASYSQLLARIAR